MKSVKKTFSWSAEIFLSYFRLYRHCTAFFVPTNDYFNYQLLILLIIDQISKDLLRNFIKLIGTKMLRFLLENYKIYPTLKPRYIEQSILQYFLKIKFLWSQHSTILNIHADALKLGAFLSFSKVKFLTDFLRFEFFCLTFDSILCEWSILWMKRLKFIDFSDN